ncbi:hypothetical protein HALLA_11665 [Halostagnicola larsenii XH-48]|uniref:Uncharacterized protein n=1 Tax=Halostagnicola larsenii XH-48 TaxID=797299 RepID=W0JV34_9EURY|nr:hypothetical protein [Halostagnicola larsenii]AHG00898.1 hypothetical protein HALLA_11665 [Halostagnicola larsenii XH-48]
MDSTAAAATLEVAARDADNGIESHDQKRAPAVGEWAYALADQRSGPP